MAALTDLATEWQRFRWRHPEWTLLVVTVAAWVAVFVTARHGGASESAIVPTSHTHGAPQSASAVHEPISAGHWALMVVAMMLPTVVPAAREIALGGIWNRRQRGPWLFAAAYLGVWVVVGLAAIVVLRPLELHSHGPWLLAAALGIAALWELTAWKPRLLRACHRIKPVPPRGWKADWHCLFRGTTHAQTCVGSCWALMLPMLIVDHVVAMMLMLPLTVIIVPQRLAAQPKRTVRPVAAVLVLLAAASMLGTS